MQTNEEQAARKNDSPDGHEAGPREQQEGSGAVTGRPRGLEEGRAIMSMMVRHIRVILAVVFVVFVGAAISVYSFIYYINESFGHINESFGHINKSFDHTNNLNDGLGKKVDSLNGKVEGLNDKVERLRESLRDLSRELQTTPPAGSGPVSRNIRKGED
jgi:hypothetical protein